MQGWRKEPLLHFGVAGVLLFAAYAWLGRDAGEGAETDRVVRITAAQVEWLKETWTRQWQRPPGDDELRGLVDSFIKEELLAREAKELGLDEDDTVVRRRLAQKLEFLVQDTTQLAEPTEAELRRFHEANAEMFESEARVSFTHVFFSPDRRPDAAADARAALVSLSRAGAGSVNLGDRLLLDAEMHLADESAVAAQFGREFTDALFALEPGAWAGPIESAYGLHLVRVSAAEPGRRRELGEVRARALERWREEQERRANAQFFARLLEKYDVVADESVRPFVAALPARAAGG